MQKAESKIDRFRALHERGCFVIPNPWDAGSARYLEHLGFKAAATTSAGAAFSMGLPDGGVSRDDMLAHIAGIVRATDLPVNADFQAAYAATSDEVRHNVRLCCGTGVAGLSVEDREGGRLFEFDIALDRVRAARAGIDEGGTGVLLTARSECYLAGHENPFEEARRRLIAFAEAGADVLFAPGVTKIDEIRAIVAAVAPKPVNVLVFGNIGLSVQQLADAAVRRISTGGALARCAWAGFIRAAKEIFEHGTFTEFDDAMPGRELNQLFENYSR